jgi:hypothetical protein
MSIPKKKTKKRAIKKASKEMLSEALGGIGRAFPKKAKKAVRKSIPLGITPKIGRR